MLVFLWIKVNIFIYNRGALYSNYYEFTSTLGIRPIITISKDALKKSFS